MYIMWHTVAVASAAGSNVFQLPQTARRSTEDLGALDPGQAQLSKGAFNIRADEIKFEIIACVRVYSADTHVITGVVNISN
jgi:hypothetical protein